MVTILLSFQSNIYLVRITWRISNESKLDFWTFLNQSLWDMWVYILGRKVLARLPSNIPRGRSCSGRGWEFLKCLKNKSSGYVSKFHEGSAGMRSWNCNYFRNSTKLTQAYLIDYHAMQWYFEFVTYHEKPGPSNMQLLELLRHERIKEKDKSKNIEE